MTSRAEYADVAAVIDRVANETGAAVSVYGHSYGAVCALGAAALTRNLKRLFIYEPGFQAVVAALHRALASSDVVALPGQAHAAPVTAPELIANGLLRVLPGRDDRLSLHQPACLSGAPGLHFLGRQPGSPPL